MEEKVLVEPQRLWFNGPFTERHHQELRLINLLEQSVLFKMKSTHPKQFKTRPVYGYLEPKSSHSVRVVLRPIPESEGWPTKDRISVIVLQVPHTNNRASLVWKSLSHKDLKDCHRLVVPVSYEAPKSHQQPEDISSERHMKLLAKKLQMEKKLLRINEQLDEIVARKQARIALLEADQGTQSSRRKKKNDNQQKVQKVKSVKTAKSKKRKRGEDEDKSYSAQEDSQEIR